MDTLTDYTTDEALAFMDLLKSASVLPDWVTEVPLPSELTALPSSAFADTARRLFPMHTKAAAYASAVSTFAYGTAPGPWVGRLKSACHAYGIVEEVKAAHAVLARTDSTESEVAEVQKIACALELVAGPGEMVTGYYPINCRHAVETSAEKMATDIREHRLPEAVFAEAAEKLVKAAAEFNVPENHIPAKIRALGEIRLPSPDYLKLQVELRQKQASLSQEAANIYAEAAQSVIRKESSMLEAAELWELADLKFQVKVAGQLVSPITAFKSGRTQASVEKEARSVCFIADVMVPYRNLLSLSPTVVAASFEKAAAAAILQAQSSKDGIEASQKLASVSEADQVSLLSLLTEIHG